MSPSPTALPGIAAAWVGMVVFVALLLLARAGRGSEDRATSRTSRASLAGIVLQGLATGLVCAGPPHLTLDPLSALALAEAAAVALLMALADALFFWSSRTMGRNWSVVARTRADHALVTTGPFALVRHPIYVALFLTMAAFAIAFGHEARLILGVPLYALGTWLRIREEERLLHDRFGPDYRAYATRVRRFVPGIF